MEKSTSVRRKAQQLARSGQVQRAIEAMDRLLQEGDPDPYDFVFNGDLLIRGKRLEDAIRSFQESVDAYERVGLYRNAIAVGKKILRADPTRARTYQRLGELYAKEGLAGEAVTHLLAFLDKSSGEVSGEEYSETLERIAELSGPKVEVALRLAELYVRAGQESRAAELLEEVARQAEGNGGPDIATILRERAAELVPPADAPAEQAAAETPGPAVVEIEEFAEFAASLAEEPPAAPPREPSSAGYEPPAASPDPAWEAIEESWAAERWQEVRALCLDLIEQDPDRIDATEKLVAVSRRLGDTLATIRHLSLVGDLRIAREDLEGALACFLEVLEMDPQDVTARRRLARFREMNVPGADRIPEECRSSIQGVIETNGATVAVRESGGVETEEWIDLTTLLQEFREGVREKVPPEDHAGHYDLALSHLEMGLYEEALEEFDAVLLSHGLPPEIEMKTREMRGTCLCRLQRHREAIHEYRAGLEVPDRPEEERNAMRYQLASALQSAGEAQEARSLFRDLGEEARSSDGIPARQTGSPGG